MIRVQGWMAAAVRVRPAACPCSARGCHPRCSRRFDANRCSGSALLASARSQSAVVDLVEASRWVGSTLVNLHQTLFARLNFRCSIQRSATFCIFGYGLPQHQSLAGWCGSSQEWSSLGDPKCLHPPSNTMSSLIFRNPLITKQFAMEHHHFNG